MEKDVLSFAKWLELVIGEDWSYFDNNYSEEAVNQLYDEYDYYCKHPEDYPECTQTKTQSYTSANTSINSSKLPRVYTLMDDLHDCSIVDYGCGKYTDHLIQWAKNHNILWCGYDKYNQPDSVNECAFAHLEDADYIFCSNVLNVIAEDDIIADIIRDIVVPYTTTIITVYEGNRSGVGKVTGADQYQRNQKKSWYVDFIRSLGYHATSKNGYIMVTM